MAPAAAAMAMNGVGGDKSPAAMAGGLKGLECQLAGLSMASSTSSTIPAQTSSAAPGSPLTSKEAIDAADVNAPSTAATGQAGAAGDQEGNVKENHDVASGHSTAIQNQSASHELSNEQSSDLSAKSNHRDGQEQMGRGSSGGTSHIANGDGADGQPRDNSGTETAAVSQQTSQQQKGSVYCGLT